MQTLLSQLSVLLIAIFISFTLPACTAKTDDASVQQRINDELKKDQAGAALNATVDKGVATITGECHGDNCVADLAEKVRKIHKYICLFHCMYFI